MLNIITGGYKLPFIAYLQPMIAKNHHSTVKHAKFVEESIGDLVHSHCARELMSCPVVCSPLIVVANAKGKLRLVIDIRYTNQFLIQYKFKYEGLDLISWQGDFVLSFDLTSGYHHVDIHEESQPYLGFPEVRVVERNFIFLCAPFWLIHCFRSV